MENTVKPFKDISSKGCCFVLYVKYKEIFV